MELKPAFFLMVIENRQNGVRALHSAMIQSTQDNKDGTLEISLIFYKKVGATYLIKNLSNSKRFYL